MKKGRLNDLKRAGLFLALFAFGMGSAGLRSAQASSFLSTFPGSGFSAGFFTPTTPAIPVIAPPSASVGLSLGTPANQAATLTPSSPNTSFAAFSLSGSTAFGAFSSFGFHSVAGFTTAPAVTAGPP
ncbi:MAG: hypothetical protein M3Z85_05670, partial [Acidobacteriota bacterium]|nr:hypothetical protein [Acidobacteriota bacterium]